MAKKAKKKEGKMLSKLRESPINYFSDLLIVAMVVFWIADNVWESIVASIVTLSSVWLSIQAGYNCYDTSMWSSIGTNVAIPLASGGAIWMIKNAVQHAIANNKGKQAHKDFPRVDGTDDSGAEPEMFTEETADTFVESEAEG